MKASAPPIELAGRDTELASVEAFLAAVPDGGAAVILEGPAGIGKTTLWNECVARAAARSYRVLSCRPAELEAQLSFVALADLLEEALEEALEELPEPRRYPLEVALLRRDPGGQPPDARAVSVAALALVRLLTAEAPVVVAVDDVQWLDPASARVLEFVLRRTENEPLGLAAAIRTEGEAMLPLGLDRASPDRRLDRIGLTPLSLGALHHLVRTRTGLSPARSTLVRLEEVSGGNPFFALELARALQRRGEATTIEEPLPVPVSLRELVRERLGALPDASREVVLAAAALSRPTPALVERAVGRPEAADDLVHALDAGVLELDRDRLRFSHPLLASVVYADASQLRRRSLHARLAETVEDDEEQARHLALAAAGPAEKIAAALEDAARGARARGAPDAAADLAELALRLTPDPEGEAGSQRLFLAAESRFLTGDSGRARSLLETLVESLPPGALRVRSLLLLSEVLYWTAGAADAVARAEEALAEAGADPLLAGRCHAELSVFYDFDAAASERHAEAAVALLDRDGEIQDGLVTALRTGARARLMLGRGLDRATVERAGVLEEQLAPPHRTRAQLGQWLKYVDDFEGARALLEEARRSAVEQGDESSLPNILMHLALTELWSGNWEQAAEVARESCAIAEQLGQSFGAPATCLALVDAHLGNVEPARARATEGLKTMETDPLVALLSLRVLGFLALSLGDAEDCGRHLSRALELAEASDLLEPGVTRIHADLVEALIALGELERAEPLLARFERQAKEVALPWSLATSARCRALLHAARGDLDAARQTVEQALEAHERLPGAFERGRTLLVRGRIHRRRKEKLAARADLEAARGIFDSLGARLWAEQALTELGRLGLRRGGDRDSLTPTEERVARLVADGLTNREVAGIAFMSEKTVEANLSRIYRKLAIDSRRQLGRRLAALDEVDGPSRAGQP